MTPFAIVLGSPNPMLQHWMQYHSLPWRCRVPSNYAIDLDRNSAIAWFLQHVPARFDTLISLDNDVVPVPIGETTASLEMLLTSREPVAFCDTPSSFGQGGHRGDGQLGACAFAIRRNVLLKTGPPWFSQVANPQRTVRSACECEGFRKRLISAGFPPKHVGTAGDQAGNGGVVFYSRPVRPAIPPDSPPHNVLPPACTGWLDLLPSDAER